MIEIVDGSTDTAAAARIRRVVFRWLTFEPETIEHFRATRLGFRDWLALLDGEPVGAGACAPNPGNEESSAALAVPCVLPEARGRGVGTALYRELSAHARSLGKSQLLTWCYEDDPAGIAFAERRGFVEVTRSRALRLLLERCPRPSVSLPAGVEMTTLAEHPELAHGVWETARETMPDIPYDDDAPADPGPYQHFVEFSLSGPRYIPEATFVALHDREVIGYGQLGWMNREDGIGDHLMIAVRRSWRGRGIAKALKAAQITWALDNGLTELRTGNDERNAPARAVNANFPYAPLPDQVVFRGPLADQVLPADR